MGKTQCNIAIQIKQRKIRCAVLAPGVSKILGKKTKKHGVSYVSQFGNFCRRFRRAE